MLQFLLQYWGCVKLLQGVPCLESDPSCTNCRSCVLRDNFHVENCDTVLYQQINGWHFWNDQQFILLTLRTLARQVGNNVEIEIENKDRIKTILGEIQSKFFIHQINPWSWEEIWCHKSQLAATGKSGMKLENVKLSRGWTQEVIETDLIHLYLFSTEAIAWQEHYPSDHYWCSLRNNIYCMAWGNPIPPLPTQSW